MAIPSLKLSLSSSAKSGDASSPFTGDSSGFSVNFGNGVQQGNSTPQLSPLMIGMIVLGAVLWKKYS